MFGGKEQALRGLFSSSPPLSCPPHSLPTLFAVCGDRGNGRKKKKGGEQKKYINQMYDVNTCYHGDYGALQDGETGFEKEKDKRGRFVPELGT